MTDDYIYLIRTEALYIIEVHTMIRLLFRVVLEKHSVLAFTRVRITYSTRWRWREQLTCHSNIRQTFGSFEEARILFFPVAYMLRNNVC